MEESTYPKKKRSYLKFNPHSIRSRIALGFASTAALFLVFTVIAAIGMYGLVEKGKFAIENYQPSIAHTYAMMKGTNQSLSLLKENVYRNDPVISETLAKLWETQVTSHLDSLEKKATELNNPAIADLLDRIKNQEAQLKSKFFNAIALPYQPAATAEPLASLSDSIRLLLPVLPSVPTVYHHAALDQYIENEISPAFAELSAASHDYIKLIDKNIADQREEVKANLDNFILFGGIMFGVLVGFLIVAIIYIPKGILKSINQLKKYIDTLSKGDFPTKITISQNELSDIAILLKSFINDLKNIKLFAQHVGNKDFDNEIKVFDDHGELGTSLAEMRTSLKKVSEEDKVRYWTNEGLAKFGEILRNNTNNLSEISEHIITNLVKYLNANQGGIFIYNDEQEDDKHLELKACYAFDRKKFVEKKVYPGQGLVGQCYLEEEYIYITQVPENYIDITSGLGDANPRSILIVPLKVNEETYGIIEMASLHPFESHHIDFVLKISESIANTISSVKVNEKTQSLLENSQEMTEQMRAQEEEMRQNMEELQATQEEVERKGRELTEFTIAINKSSMIIEFEPDGSILNANDKFCSVTQYASLDIVGKPERSIVPQEFIDTGAYDERWNNLQTEEFVETDVQRLKKDGSLMWMRAYYFPIKDEKQRVKKISCICSDITEEKNTLEELRLAQEKIKESEKNKQSMKKPKKTINEPKAKLSTIKS